MSEWKKPAPVKRFDLKWSVSGRLSKNPQSHEPTPGVRLMHTLGNLVRLTEKGRPLKKWNFFLKHHG